MAARYSLPIRLLQSTSLFAFSCLGDRQRHTQSLERIARAHQRRRFAAQHGTEVIELAGKRIGSVHRYYSGLERPPPGTLVRIAPQAHCRDGERSMRAGDVIAI